jgi:integrase
VPAFTPDASTITVGELLDRWLDEAVALTVRPRTLASYTYIVRVHLRPALGDVPLASLTAQHVQGLLNAKAASGLAPRTVGYLRGVLRQALGFAERMDLVGRNVARLARPPRVPRRQVSPLTIEQARIFRAAVAGDRLEALYLVAVGCGLRQGEILGLRWGDVDLEGRTLRVRFALARVSGELALVEPKSATSRRTVPMPTFVAEALAAHRVRQAAEAPPAGRRRPTRSRTSCSQPRSARRSTGSASPGASSGSSSPPGCRASGSTTCGTPPRATCSPRGCRPGW